MINPWLSPFSQGDKVTFKDEESKAKYEDWPAHNGVGWGPFEVDFCYSHKYPSGYAWWAVCYTDDPARRIYIRSELLKEANEELLVERSGCPDVADTG